MEQFVSNIIETTLNSFDFALVIAINIVTYLVIKFIDEINGEGEVNKWVKRLVMLVVTILISVIYLCFEFSESRLILNSAILAPVFWRWIGKPIVNKFGIDYKRGDS